MSVHVHRQRDLLTVAHVRRAEFPEAKVDLVRLDLSDLKSVRSYGKEAQQQGQPLDVLLNNAGPTPPEVTKAC